MHCRVRLGKYRYGLLARPDGGLPTPPGHGCPRHAVHRSRSRSCPAPAETCEASFGMRIGSLSESESDPGIAHPGDGEHRPQADVSHGWASLKTRMAITQMPGRWGPA